MLKHPYHAISDVLSKLYAAVTPHIPEHERAGIESNIREVKALATAIDEQYPERPVATAEEAGELVEAATAARRDPLDRDGVDGTGGSLPDGWSLLDGVGPKVVRDEDGLTLANAYVLRAVLSADPTGENVQVFDVAPGAEFDASHFADLDPTWGVVAHYVDDNGKGSAAVFRNYDPERKAPEPEPAPAPEVEAPPPAPEPAAAAETDDSEENWARVLAAFTDEGLAQAIIEAEADAPTDPEAQTALDRMTAERDRRAAEANPQPDWTGFDEDPSKWTPEQNQTFDDWFNDLPEGAEVKINHIGVVQAFSAAKAEWEAAKKAAAPGQEGGQDGQVDPATSTETSEAAEEASTAASEPEAEAAPERPKKK